MYRPDRPRLELLAALVLSLSLAACGAAGADTLGKVTGSGSPAASAPATFSIATRSLPSVPAGTPYPLVQLQATGASGTVSWSLATGRLPAGLQLASSGLLSGTPAEEGLFAFGVLATDGVGADARTLTVSVGVFGVEVTGLRFGSAWDGTPVTLRTVGGSGPVRFEILSNGSGGYLDRIDETTGTAVYVPGAITACCEDRLCATDLSNGATSDVTLEVMPNPVRHMTGEFGTSDVWYVAVEAKNGTHAFSRDIDAALNEVGLRSAASTGVTGAEWDEIAALLVRRTMISRLNVLFGRNADGTRGSGLPISFCFERPDPSFAAPAAGTWTYGATNRYSVISLIHGSNPGTVGTAMLDGITNPLVENDTTAPGIGELGVFANRLVGAFNAIYANYALAADPVSSGDLDALRALLYGLPSPGGRYAEIARIVEGFGETLAQVAGHEIGHSLGLGHTSPYTPGSVMNASLVFGPTAEPRFLDPAWAVLQGGLPGPGRTGASGRSLEASYDLPAGGIQVCNLRLAEHGCDCAHGR